jgi:hypothetical protein
MNIYCIPDLQFDLFATSLYDFGAEFDTNGSIMIEFKFFL